MTVLHFKVDCRVTDSPRAARDSFIGLQIAVADVHLCKGQSGRERAATSGV